MTAQAGPEDHPDVLEVGAERPRGRRRRVLLRATALFGLLGLVVPVSVAANAASGSSQVNVQAASAAGVPAPVCPASTTPQNGGGYAVGISAKIENIVLNNGWNEKAQVWQSTAENISAKACGLLRLPSLRVDIAASGLVFDTSQARITSGNNIFNSTDFAVDLKPTGPAVNNITGVRTDGTLDLAATTPLRATVLPGSKSGGTFACPTDASATLSTGISTKVPTGRGAKGPQQQLDPKLGLLKPPPWTVTGTPLTGSSLIGATALIAGNDFTLPLFTEDFNACPSGFLLNIAFGGADSTGTQYYPGPGPLPYGTTHPAGASWAMGTLTITGLDPAAIPAGPPPASSPAIVPACVPPPGPPFRLGVAGSFSGAGIVVTPGVSISKLSGKLCGTATVIAAPRDTHPGATVCTRLVAPAAGQQFDSLNTELSLIPTVRSVISQVSVTPEDLTADFCNDGKDGELKVNTTIRASAVPHLFGTGCLVGPLVAPATGVLSGPLSGAGVTLASPPFAINAVQPGPLCPSGLAANTNQILGLPLAASTNGLTIDTKAGLYVPK